MAPRPPASGETSGATSRSTALVGLADITAQYWCTPDASTGNFSSLVLRPGTYTQTLVQDELAVAAWAVGVTADTVTAGQNIASSWTGPPARAAPPASRVPEACRSAPVAATTRCSRTRSRPVRSSSAPRSPAVGLSAQANSPPTPRNLLVCASKPRRRRRKVGPCVQSVNPPRCPPPLWLVVCCWARPSCRSPNSASDAATRTRNPKRPVHPRCMPLTGPW
ncbi:hypothetical protein ABZX95_36185 [Streptomyces sp. NPDC004232]|uniref:hypothetical protein n=1 Tax=Streptomyces sp. NPDC004232 TaxID=3154454 RepID=UPI0033A34FCC